MLAIGTQAPDFTLPDQNGEMKSLSASFILSSAKRARLYSA